MKTKAFTLIEMLIVVAIIGILVAIAVPALNTARADAQAARRNAIINAVQSAKMRYVLSSKKPLPKTEAGRWEAIQPYLQERNLFQNFPEQMMLIGDETTQTLIDETETPTQKIATTPIQPEPATQPIQSTPAQEPEGKSPAINTEPAKDPAPTGGLPVWGAP